MRAGGKVSASDELVRAEANLEEWAIGLPSSRTRLREFTQEREIEAEVGGRTVLMRQSWTMRAGGAYALPGEFDQDVYFALLCLVEGQGGMPDDGIVGFSMYELLGVLGRKRSGRDYRQLSESLDRLSATSYRSKSAFYSASRRRRVTDTFWLFGVTTRETLPIGDPREEALAGLEDDLLARGLGHTHTVVRFSPQIVESYKGGYLTVLDPEIYFRLPSAVSRRLYRVVEHGRGGSMAFEMGLTDLRDRIPLSPKTHRYPAQIRRPLDAAHEALTRAGFLQDVVYRGGGAEQRARYRISKGYAARRERGLGDGSQNSPGRLVARERLLSEGVEPHIADRLVHDHGAERVLEAADALAARPAGTIGNPAGWLVRAVEKGWRHSATPQS